MGKEAAQIAEERVREVGKEIAERFVRLLFEFAVRILLRVSAQKYGIAQRLEPRYMLAPRPVEGSEGDEFFHPKRCLRVERAEDCIEASFCGARGVGGNLALCPARDSAFRKRQNFAQMRDIFGDSARIYLDVLCGQNLGGNPRANVGNRL